MREPRSWDALRFRSSNQTVQGKSVQEQVEVDETSIRPPAFENSPDPPVIPRAGEAQEIREVVQGPDISARKHFEPPQPPQEDITGGPRADAGDRLKGLHHVPIVPPAQGFQVEAAFRHPASDVQNRRGLAPAVAEASKVLGARRGDLQRPGEHALVPPCPGSKATNQSVQESDPDRNGQLLATDSIQ